MRQTNVALVMFDYNFSQNFSQIGSEIEYPGANPDILS